MIRTALSCAVALSLSAAFAFGGDLNPPPGPVAPTMKTLEEVEPSTPINTLPGNQQAVHIITAPGAYHLTGNITSQGAGRYAIVSGAPGVTIDLRGFAIIGNSNETLPAIQLSPASRVHNGTIAFCGGGGVGTLSNSVIEDVIFENVRGGPVIQASRGTSIRRCTFRLSDPMELDDGTMLSGIHTQDMDEAIVSPGANGVTILDSLFDGQNTSGSGSVIVLGDDAKLGNVIVREEGNTGLTAGNNASVIACTFSGNGTSSNPGLVLGNNALVKDCSISLYGGFGVDTNFGAVIRDNAVFNNGGGISCTVSGQIAGNSVYANSGDGIDVSNGAVITGNLVRNNSGNGLSAGTDCLITNNQFVNNSVQLGSRNTFDQNASTSVETSLTLTGTENRVTRNTVGGSINMSHPFSNYRAPIFIPNLGITNGPWHNLQSPS